MDSEFFILGLTSKGKQFRPSDWAERLCGVMACVAPTASGPHGHLGYSSMVTPTVINGVKAVVVNSKLREMQPLAYNFVVEFAKDNDLQVADACLLPDEKV